MAIFEECVYVEAWMVVLSTVLASLAQGSLAQGSKVEDDDYDRGISGAGDPERDLTKDGLLGKTCPGGWREGGGEVAAVKDNISSDWSSSSRSFSMNVETTLIMGLLLCGDWSTRTPLSTLCLLNLCSSEAESE
ncbi:hypothetical protein WICPIJ_001383 [Wickerhamomyces pijperi]|uniref:Uncharacterized protein n=1 Tax=Wickerhamomyces pijperi TaxID=599730 RepID=A0A9P8QDE8_WICPI|nr:hypothetical protein WICPIJ_001383 [Wickerhamomyces pijperi]